MSSYTWKVHKIPAPPGEAHPTWRFEVWRGDHLAASSGLSYPTVLSAGIAAKRMIAELEKQLH